MGTPTSTGSYTEVTDTSATREVLDSQAGDIFPNRPIVSFLRNGERGHLTPADVALMPLLPSSPEVAAALSVAPGVARSDQSGRLGPNRQVASARTVPNNSRVDPANARPTATRARRAARPLGLVPRLTRSLTDFARPPARVQLMGVRIDCVTEKQVIAHVISSIRNGIGGWIVTPNVDHLRIISERPDLLATVNEASLKIADGMPLIWASRIQGTPLPERVTGAGLTASLSAAASKVGASIFFLGGNPGDGEAAAAVLGRLNPGLRVAGILCPPLGFENDSLQMTEIANTLRSAKPDLVYTCFGFPKDPLVISALRHCLPLAWFLGLGGSLAIVSGRTRRAPRSMQRIGMEWLWRLGLEPRRLFRRYIVEDIPFAIRMLANALVQH
jgi:N-acetylglucosaminyldiphosphoundecaprenol N-acetyl-beta-D-mannosaminyltransferase